MNALKLEALTWGSFFARSRTDRSIVNVTLVFIMEYYHSHTACAAQSHSIRDKKAHGRASMGLSPPNPAYFSVAIYASYPAWSFGTAISP